VVLLKRLSEQATHPLYDADAAVTVCTDLDVRGLLVQPGAAACRLA
jgi:hypothetical protein